MNRDEAKDILHTTLDWNCVGGTEAKLIVEGEDWERARKELARKHDEISCAQAALAALTGENAEGELDSREVLSGHVNAWRAEAKCQGAQAEEWLEEGHTTAGRRAEERAQTLEECAAAVERFLEKGAA